MKHGTDSPKPEKKQETTPEFIASVALVLVVGLFIITFNLQAFEIPSSSMENSIGRPVLHIRLNILLDRGASARTAPAL